MSMTSSHWSTPPLIRAQPAMIDWRRPALWHLRWLAWRMARRHPGDHPIAELICRGDWATLDGLLAEIDQAPAAAPAPESVTARTVSG